MSNQNCKKVLAQLNGEEYKLFSCKCSSCEVEDTLMLELQNAEARVSEILPKVTDFPPMPKCKPPKPEFPKEIEIETVSFIIGKMIADGDLREGEFDEPYIYQKGDDLGFYQQACEFLLKKVDRIKTCENGHEYVANSHEYPCPLCTLKYIRNKLK